MVRTRIGRMERIIENRTGTTPEGVTRCEVYENVRYMEVVISCRSNVARAVYDPLFVQNTDNTLAVVNR